MKTAVIIVAAGTGSRMGAARPKIFLPLAGRSVLSRAVDAFLRHPRIDEIVVAVANEKEASEALGIAAGELRFVKGGAHRQDSVRSRKQLLRIQS